MANSNNILHAAKAAKKDEFYTQLYDIELELKHYREQFKDKVVLCNCDDPRISNFVKYFALNFEVLELKRLICTCYKNQDIDLFSQKESEKAVHIIYDGDKNGNDFLIQKKWKPITSLLGSKVVRLLLKTASFYA